MPRYVNPFTPMTPIGETFNNLAVALFANQRDPNRQALDEAHAGYYDAERMKAMEQVNALRAGNIARRGAGSKLLQAETGLNDQDTAALENFTHQGNWGTQTRVAPMGAGSAVMDKPVPQWFTPEVKSASKRSRRLQAVVDMGGDKSNADQIAKAMQELSLFDTSQGVLGGTVDPTRAAQAFFPGPGHAPYTGQREGATNVLTGTQSINPIGQADISEKGAKAGLYGEQAKTQGSRRELLGAQTELAKARAGEVRKGKTGKTVAVTPNLSRQAAPAVLGAFGIQYDKQGKLLPGSKPELAPETESAIMSRWSEIYQATQNSAQATQQVVDEFGPQLEGYDTGVPDPNTGFLGFGKSNVQGRRKADGGKPFTPPKAAPKSASTTRPAQIPDRKGKSDQQLIDEANAAIKAGRDPDLVLKRLHDFGVKTD